MKMKHNPFYGVTLMTAPDSPGGGDGSADNGDAAPGNAEKQLENAFGEAGSGAAAEGAEPPDGTVKGEGPGGGPDTGSETKPPAWAGQLPKETRENPEAMAKLAGFAKVGDLAKAFLEREGKAASNEAGRPETAEGYVFAKEGDGGPEFARAAFEANLTKTQAETLYKSMKELGAAKLSALREEGGRRVRETAAALAAEYGPRYAEKMELLTRGLAAAGPGVAGLIKEAGLAGEPEIVKAFIAFGEMTSESGSSRGSGAGEPLKSVFEGGSFDYKT